MYNRYKGNTGRVERVDDGEHHGNRNSMPPHPYRGYPPPPTPPGRGYPPQPPPPPPGRRPSILDALDGILPKKLEGFETEDLLMLLILYLMYKDSGDKELLIIMGAMFLL